MYSSLSLPTKRILAADDMMLFHCASCCAHRINHDSSRQCQDNSLDSQSNVEQSSKNRSFQTGKNIRIVEERRDARPVAPPALADGRIVLVPFGLKRRQMHIHHLGGAANSRG